LVLFFSCSFLGKAQLKNHFLNKQSSLFQTHHSLSFNCKGIEAIENINTMMMSNHIPLQALPKTISSGSINDLPFFCAMECKVRKCTNIWIKLRTGDDESYMKLIQSASR
jgi:hypothetical protein